MKVSEKLKERLEKEFGITATNFKRTYAGWHQREEGAWRWSARTFKGDIGSQYPMTYLLKCKKIEVDNFYGDLDINPVDD